MKKIIGITGIISSGKSSVIKILIDKGYFIIDADVISKEITLKGNQAYEMIKKSFGDDFFIDDKLDRKKLGSLIFNDINKREELNNIMHPIIKKEIINRINNSNNDIIFLDIPLLFESKMDDLCDFIVCVYSDKDIIIERLMKRDNISFEYALKKINSQLSLEKKKELSDYIIYNNSSLEDLYIEVDKMLERIDLIG